MDTLTLKPVKIFEIREYDGEGGSKAILQSTNELLRDLDMLKFQIHLRYFTAEKELHISEDGKIYEVKYLGIDASMGRDEKEEFRQSLMKTLSPEQLEYLKKNPL